jgi:hypothetical protein
LGICWHHNTPHVACGDYHQIFAKTGLSLVFVILHIDRKDFSCKKITYFLLIDPAHIWRDFDQSHRILGFSPCSCKAVGWPQMDGRKRVVAPRLVTTDHL